VTLGKAGQKEVEIRVVDEDQDIGAILNNMSLDLFPGFEDDLRVPQDFEQSHDGQFTVVDEDRCARTFQARPAEAGHPRLGVKGPESPDKVRSVEISRSFTGTEEYFHRRVFSLDGILVERESNLTSHRGFLDSGVRRNDVWMGNPVSKCPVICHFELKAKNLSPEKPALTIYQFAPLASK
jgi:hypothetical protein